MPTAIVPAAGQSARFGSMKLFADIDGVVLVDRTIGSLLDAGAARVLVVCTGVEALSRASLAGDPRVRIVVNPHPERGMFSSIQTGLAEAGDGDLLVLPADMPFVRSDTIRLVAERLRQTDAVVVPGIGLRRGHPVGIPSRLRLPLVALRPDSSLKDALRQLDDAFEILEVDDSGILRDVDVPADLQ
ncbi:MAG: nucleotidyltransferase family protein [Acidobacteriota bacterium]